MENFDRRMLLAGLGLVGAAAAATAGAGTLNPPPGPVAPTGKTTDEIEPRIVVQSLPGDGTSQFLISQPGSYHLTGNINGVFGKSAIAIASDNVSLDLGGFALIGVAGATLGIDLRNTRSQVSVRNGSIRTFDSGGIKAGNNSSHCRVDGVSVVAIANGVGISLGANSISGHVRNCDLSGIGGSGIVMGTGDPGLVENCVISNCTGIGQISGIVAPIVVASSVTRVTSTAGDATAILGSMVDQCVVFRVTSISGFAVGIFGSTVNASRVILVDATGTMIGISAPDGSVADCTVFGVGTSGGNTGASFGIRTGSAANCTVTSMGSSGSTIAPVGISANSVSHCTVSQIGQTTSAVGAIGVSGKVISGCDVSLVRGGSFGSTIGISGTVVSTCNVDSLSQGSSPDAVIGVTADAVTNCHITSIAGSTSAVVSGISGTTMVRDCTVDSIANAGAGSAMGLNRTSTNSGSVEGSVFRSCGTVGISVGARQRIVNCSVSASTTGIRATDVRNVIDGNNVDTCTTGISAVSGTGTANALIVHNQVRNCTVNIAADAPCQVGPVVTATGTIASTNPWANFTD